MAKKIEDFGEKIGGARKDLYAARERGGLNITDIEGWTGKERSEYITKEGVFPKPDYAKLAEEGRDKTAVYFIKKVYDTIPKKPAGYDFPDESEKQEFDGINRQRMDAQSQKREAELFLKRLEKGNPMFKYGMPVTMEEMQEQLEKANQVLAETEGRYQKLKEKGIRGGQEAYIRSVGKVKNLLLTVHDKKDIENFQSVLKNEGIIKNEYGSYYSILDAQLRDGGTKFLRASIVNNAYSLEKERQEKQFLYSDDEKKIAKYFILRSDNIEIGANDRADCIGIKYGFGTRFTYNNDEKFSIPENWQENTYCILTKGSNKLIENNFQTEEEAKAFILEYEKTLEQNAPEKPAKKSGQMQVMKPPQLSHIMRIGEDFRNGTHITGEKMMQTFGFRGGEFGNWENQNDRQTNLDMSYDAFKDLAKALQIQDSDISLSVQIQDDDVSLNVQLAIAYGARGRAGAVAHYEPLADVINLTKMRGAGSLAHEWGHALDYHVYLSEREREKEEGKVREGYERGFETERWHQNGNIMHDVMDAIHYNPDGTATDYFKDAQELDKMYKKTGNQSGKYWSSDVELFARAFACYVQDILKENGERCDYLCGHAGEDISREQILNTQDGVYAHPVGEERKRINAEFGKLIEKLKERGIIQQRVYEEPHKQIQVDISVESETKKSSKKQTEQEETKPLIPENTEQKSSEQQSESVKESPEEIQEKMKQLAREIANNVKQMMEKEKIASQLQAGDVILLAERTAINSRNMKQEIIPERFATVIEATSNALQVATGEIPIKLDEIKWNTTRENILSVPDKPWSVQLAEQGFEVISVKALRMENTEQQKSFSKSDGLEQKEEFGEQLGFWKDEPAPKPRPAKEEIPDYQFGEQLSLFDMDEPFEDPTPPEKETLKSTMDLEYFKFCEPYLRNVQYEITDTSDGITLLTDNYDKLSSELERADKILTEIAKMYEYGFTAEQVNNFHNLIVQGVDTGHTCFVRESVNTNFHEQQMQDMKTVISVALRSGKESDFTAVTNLHDKFIRDNQEEKERPDFLKFPNAEQLSVYLKEAELPANAVLIAEDQQKDMQVYQSGRRFYLQEESKVREIAPEFTRMTSFDENARQFAYTPDDVHVYHLKTKGERMHIDKSVSELKLEQIKEGMSCTMPVTAQDGTEQNLTLIYRNASAVTIQTENAEKNMLVRENYDMAYKYTAKQIEAKGGAKGFFQRMEHIAEQENHGISSSMTGIYSKMLSVLPKEKEQQKAELPNFISAEQLSEYAKGIEIPDNAVMIAELNRPDFPNLHLQVFQAEDKFILKHNEKTYELAPELTEKTNAQAFAYTPDNLHVYHITAENGKANQTIAKLEREQLKEGMSCSMTFSREKGEEPKTLTVIYHENQSLTLQYDGMERTLPVEKKNGANYNYEIKKTKLNSKTGAEELYSYFDFIAEINRSGSHAASTESFQRLAIAFENENYGKHNAPTPIVSETAETAQKETVPEKVTARTDSYDNMLIDIYASIELYAEDSRKANETTDWKQMKEAYEDFLTECGTSESEFSDDTVCHVLTELENLAELDKDSSMNPTLLNYALNQLEVMIEGNIPVEETKENLFYQ